MTTQEERRARVEREVTGEVLTYIDGDAENGPRYGVDISETDIAEEVARRLATTFAMDEPSVGLDYRDSDTVEVNMTVGNGDLVATLELTRGDLEALLEGFDEQDEDDNHDVGWNKADDRPWGEQQSQVDWMESRFDTPGEEP